MCDTVHIIHVIYGILLYLLGVKFRAVRCTMYIYMYV